MSLVVSSTTDSQEAVNAAAGIEAPPAEEAQKPREVPFDDGDTEDNEEPEEPEPDEEDSSDKPAAEAKKPKGGFQRKIERLQAQNEQREQRIRELEAERQRYVPPQQQQQAPAGPPRAEDYPNDYEAYNRAVIRYEARQEIEQELKARVEAQRQYQEQKAQQEIDQRWYQGIQALRQEAADFEDTLENVSHIIMPPWIEAAIKRDPNGAKLAYELARHPEEFQKIVEIPNPLEGVSALGEFRGSIKSQVAAPRKVASDAPAPIRPVGQSASGTRVTRNLDELSYQDYKRAREREIKARKQR